ncbi:MAG: hypothetical protein AN483_08215 [Aphanizomenon flos-aquae MDT14a]|jgi:hypothetical protein|uniref:Spore protein YkvP/CgeB glycosyl transferase-like domain-containing protein n=1 Tax=Aphanizomenon flos-aquae LD13 TaxID=1710894 RepID=A0A1B7W010_APHFL|nr:glycosyltransferase [Aphanizomenon flos-aquae UKL13-PB]OBQ26611.1 MAG: hypothetical protein AN481_04225 [Aphanizomenon flos-aquae LD13]OBQ29854.1 MAG: hypothetical protein AN483_08215 [Aphanizomenon flos-aquae MDT14a]QSV67481.1 MAG: glycosyltransferase [Aphanizomenon flos-aquae DEX188]HCQ23227.1 hypothetical protein [Anabaena sp. UBA12330]
MKIAFIGQPEYFRFCYEKELDLLGEVREFNLNFSMGLNNFIPLQEFNADINVFFRGEFVPNEILTTLKGIKVNLSSEIFPKYIDQKLIVSLDSLSRYEHFVKAIKDKPFDYVFHYDQTSIKFMQEDNLFLSGEFCFPVATESYKPQDISEKWDFFFIGRSTEHRESFFGSLKHHYNFLHICHGIWGEPLVNYMNQSKILLNIHAESEISWEPRVQMLMATGKMVISEKLSYNNYFTPGQDYVEISSPEELYQKAKYYLENDHERFKIAENGRKKVLNYLSSKEVFTQFFEDLKNHKYQKVSFTQLNKNLAQSRISRLKTQEKLNKITVKVKRLLNLKK